MHFSSPVKSVAFTVRKTLLARHARLRDARVVNDPRGALPSPERHVADLAHHACITYGVWP